MEFWTNIPRQFAYAVALSLSTVTSYAILFRCVWVYCVVTTKEHVLEFTLWLCLSSPFLILIHMRYNTRCDLHDASSHIISVFRWYVREYVAVSFNLLLLFVRILRQLAHLLFKIPHSILIISLSKSFLNCDYCQTRTMRCYTIMFIIINSSSSKSIADGFQRIHVQNSNQNTLASVAPEGGWYHFGTRNCWNAFAENVCLFYGRDCISFLLLAVLHLTNRIYLKLCNQWKVNICRVTRIEHMMMSGWQPQNLPRNDKVQYCSEPQQFLGKRTDIIRSNTLFAVSSVFDYFFFFLRLLR